MEILKQQVTLTIPSEVLIDEYYARATITGTYSEQAIEPFNVMRFGLAEIEVKA